MGIIVEAIYENGVFKPLKKVNMPETSRILRTVGRAEHSLAGFSGSRATEERK